MDCRARRILERLQAVRLPRLLLPFLLLLLLLPWLAALVLLPGRSAAARASIAFFVEENRSTGAEDMVVSVSVCLTD